MEFFLDIRVVIDIGILREGVIVGFVVVIIVIILGDSGVSFEMEIVGGFGFISLFL